MHKFITNYSFKLLKSKILVNIC